jgi:photosystem II stability/assembly factor-like uncharacterized protein
MYKSIDAGSTWKTLPVRLVTPPAAVVEKPAPKPVRGKVATRQRVAKPVTPKPNIREISPSQVNGLYAIKNGVKDVIFAATDLGLLKSDDMGEQWTLANIPGSNAITALYFAQNFDGTLIARASAGLYLTKDYGDHWSLMPFPLPPSDINGVAIPSEPSSPLLIATRLGLYSSPDGGAKWYPSIVGIPASTVSTVLYRGDAQTAYAVEYGALYQTLDGAKSWKELPTTLRSARIRRLWTPDLKSDRLYGITSDLGIIFRN